MGCKAVWCNKISIPYVIGIFIVTPLVEGWPTKVKESPSPLKVKRTLLDTNSVFLGLKENAYPAKKSLNKFSFSLKSVTRWFVTINSGMNGILTAFKNVFKMNQKDLEASLGVIELCCKMFIFWFCWFWFCWLWWKHFKQCFQPLTISTKNFILDIKKQPPEVFYVKRCS